MTDPEGARLAPDFVLRLNQALAGLEAQAPVLHLWHAWCEPLDAARDALLQTLRERGQRVQRCTADGFLPLLQVLNTLIADSLRGAPLPSAQQVGVWVVDGVQVLPAEHAALIERILTHFPELPLRLVLLSQTALAPVGPAGLVDLPRARLLEVQWHEAQASRAPWQPEQDDAPPASAAHGGVVWVLSAAALLAVLAGGVWWAGAGGRVPRPVPAVLPPAVSAVSAPQASELATPASEAASTLAPASAALAAASIPAQAASEPAVAASAPAAKTAPRSPLQGWVQSLPEGSFLVLHGQFASAREAEAFKASDAVLANARIAQAVWTSGQPARYGVLTGPFRSSERVSNHVLRLAWREQARSLSREALLDLLNP